jgi:hypothetical protein
MLELHRTATRHLIFHIKAHTISLYPVPKHKDEIDSLGV